jgi:hypothetical protein
MLELQDAFPVVIDSLMNGNAEPPASSLQQNPEYRALSKRTSYSSFQEHASTC